MTDQSTQPAPVQGPSPEQARQHRSRTRDAIVVGAILAASAVVWWVAFGTASTLISLILALAVMFGAWLSAIRGLVASAVLAAVVIGITILTEDPDACCYAEMFRPLVVIGTFILISLAWVGGVVVGWVWRRARRKWAD
jgi:glycerol uptake facilitator-like aquaporin